MSSENGNQRPFDVNTASETELWRQKCTRLEAHVSTLKEVAHLRQNLLDLRDKEIKDLISKLKIFEESISREKESRRELSERVETAERTCTELTQKLRENIEKFNATKVSYEEKVNQLAHELEKCDQEYHKRTDELNDSELRNIELTSRLEDYNKLILENEVTVKNLREDMQVVAERNRVFSYQMNMLNTLFTEIEGTPIDFERIRAIGDIVRESQNIPITAEPHRSSDQSSAESSTANGKRSSIDFSSLMDHMDTDKFTEDIPGEESCYKKVLTVNGPQLVLSVSQTFIKLKDLIVEKKHLQRELESLKQLNSKLESKVDRQERRLYVVTTELNRTWNLVAKLKMQHSKLHNSEAVLRYELREKRKLLEKLKLELSRSRQQYAKVRQKHDESDQLCQIMRAEFARRRQASSQDSGAVSGASSSPCSSPSGDSSSEDDAECADDVHGEVSHDNSTEENEEEELEENHLDPLEELVEDLVQEIEAATSVSVENDADVTNLEGQGFPTSRASRLRQLEDASRILYSRLMATTVHGSALASRLAQLHDHYGSHDGTVPGSEAFESDNSIGMDPELPAGVATTNMDPTAAPGNDANRFDHDGINAVGPIDFSVGDADVSTDGDDLGVTVEQLVNVEIVSALADSTEHLPEMDMTQAEALMDFDSPQILAELAFSTVEPRTPAVVQATTTQIFDVGMNTTEEDTDISQDVSTETDMTDSERDTGASSSPDLSTVSRLIIQQVPKRLERLKQENATMKAREEALIGQVDEQRSRIESLESENKALTERLNQEISSKDSLIQNLQKEITNLVSRIDREKETLAVFMKSYLEEKSELESSQPSSTTNNCHKCDKKFSLLRRRRHTCRVCKRSVCLDCTTGTNTDQRGGKICCDCHRRQERLKTTALSFL